LFRADETKSRDFEDNPNAHRLISGAVFGVFLAAQYFGARILLKLRGFTFPAKAKVFANRGALSEKRGFAFFERLIKI